MSKLGDLILIRLNNFKIDETCNSDALFVGVHVCLLSDNLFNSYCSKEMLKKKNSTYKSNREFI